MRKMQMSNTPFYFTLRDFSLRENHLAGYPLLLSQEHNKRYAVRLLADAHPNPTSSDFAKLNIKRNVWSYSRQ